MIASKLFLFYLLLFLSIALIKKWRRIHIALNGIWFSHDGSLPPDVIENFSHLSKSIRRSAYRKNYRLFLWTDTKKLNSQAKKLLKRHRIEVKDYRCAFTKDPRSSCTRELLDQLLSLADTNNRLFYVMASDLFRFYLLLRYYPTQQQYAYACYLDSNDIHFNTLPPPRVFANLKSIAFHFVYFSYSYHDIFQKIIGEKEDEDHPLITNDVIITRNQQNSPFFNKLFEQYQDNLNHICHSTLNFIATLSWTKKTMKILDDDIVKVVVFTTTHMTNILHAVNDQEQRIDMLTFNNQHFKRTEITEIQDADQFISFERNYDKGFTWSLRTEELPAHHEVADQEIRCRQFWYELFLQRYKLITA